MTSLFRRFLIVASLVGFLGGAGCREEDAPPSTPAKSTDTPKDETKQDDGTDKDADKGNPDMGTQGAGNQGS